MQIHVEEVQMSFTKHPWDIGRTPIHKWQRIVWGRSQIKAENLNPVENLKVENGG